MKRTEVNNIIREADQFIRSFGYHLPPFAYLTPIQMLENRKQLHAIIEAKMGWDITDYGVGNFEQKGLFLFTTRNGTQNEPNQNTGRKSGMCYAEKIMISRREQISPLHRHISKTEDIINRGGAKLAIKMFASNEDGNIDHSKKVCFVRDGIECRYNPGETIVLSPGESVTLSPGNWHEFWGENGDVLIGEVSSVNDDIKDNIFAEPIGRFSEIEEDTDPVHLLVSDYARYLS